MKKTIKPEQKEEAVYYSDFSGKCFGQWFPPVELTIEFGYGSAYDGSSLTFHLDDGDMEDIIKLLHTKLSKEAKSSIKKKLSIEDDSYDTSVQMRDWIACDQIRNQIDLFKKLL
jgi:hypothetical protein